MVGAEWQRLYDADAQWVRRWRWRSYLSRWQWGAVRQDIICGVDASSLSHDEARSGPATSVPVRVARGQVVPSSHATPSAMDAR